MAGATGALKVEESGREWSVVSRKLPLLKRVAQKTQTLCVDDALRKSISFS